MKAFFSFRGESNKQPARNSSQSSVPRGASLYHDDDDLFYPSTPNAAAPSTSRTRRGLSKLGISKENEQSRWSEARPVPHGPASSSSASGPNAADIGSMPVAASVRSRTSNGSFAGHHRASNGVGSGIGTFLSGSNSSSSINRGIDEASSSRRSSARPGSLASLFSRGNGNSSTTNLNGQSFVGAAKGPTSSNSETMSFDDRQKAPSLQSVHTTGSYHRTYPTLSGTLARTKSRASSQASLRSDERSPNDHDTNGVGTLRGLFSGRDRDPNRRSHAPSSYYDPTYTRTKRRGITPPHLEGKASSSWPALKEAPDVHPEVFVVSNNTSESQLGSGSRIGSQQEDRGSPSSSTPAVTANEPSSIDSTLHSALNASPNRTPVVEQQTQFRDEQDFHMRSSSSMSTNKRNSAMSTATIQAPSAVREFSGRAGEEIPGGDQAQSTNDSPMIDTGSNTPTASIQGGPAGKPSLRKRISGTLRGKGSFNLLNLGSKQEHEGNSASAGPALIRANSGRHTGTGNAVPTGQDGVNGTFSILTRKSSISSIEAKSKGSLFLSSVARKKPPSISDASSSKGSEAHHQRSSSMMSTGPPNSFRLGKASSSSTNTRSHGSAPLEDLALQLNELAISHADNLLSDAEYRLLRQGLFETQLAHNSHQSAEVDIGSDRQDAGFNSQMDGNLLSTQSGSARQRAGSSHPGIVRRGSQLSHQSSISEERHPTSTAVASNSIYSGHLSSFPTVATPSRQKARSNTVSTAETQSSSASSLLSGGKATDGRFVRTIAAAAPSLHSFGKTRSMMSGSSGGSQSAERNATLGKQSELDRDGSSSIRSYATGGVGSSTARLRLMSSTSAKSQKRAQELELQARKRRAQRVNSLRSVGSGHSSSRRLGSHSAGYDDTVDGFTQAQLNPSMHERAERTSSPTGETDAARAARLTSNASRLDAQDLLYADKSSAEIEAELRVIQSEGHKVVSAFDSLESNLWSKLGDGRVTSIVSNDLPEKLDLKPLSTQSKYQSSSILKGKFSQFQSQDTPTYRKPPTISLPDGGQLNFPLTEEDSKTKSMIQELQTLRSRRNDVVNRYSERMAFLNSKSRAAAIREKLL
ncbi:unnamed protein product [Sympodiomycopsis kandeliae]